MIISASRRTDIPSYYSEWFFNRLKEEFVYVRNPMNPRRISRISLCRDVVDGIVFWTKNPVPMLGRLKELSEYPCYFQFTLNPYGSDIEKNLPSKKDVLIPAFRQLSSELGQERVVWRYDPILLNDQYTVSYHIKYFRELAQKLSGYTDMCTVSFLDLYKGIQRKAAALGIVPPSSEQEEELIGCFCEIAAERGISLNTCAEKGDFSKFGVQHAACIDTSRLERIRGDRLHIEKDRNQRAACGCAASIDIGAYHSCKSGCLYCYANAGFQKTVASLAVHDPRSPLLLGQVGGGDCIAERKVISCQERAISLAEN